MADVDVVFIDPAENPGHYGWDPPYNESPAYLAQKAEVLEAAIERTHQEEHDEIAQRWCTNPLCRVLQEWT